MKEKMFREIDGSVFIKSMKDKMFQVIDEGVLHKVDEGKDVPGDRWKCPS